MMSRPETGDLRAWWLAVGIALAPALPALAQTAGPQDAAAPAPPGAPAFELVGPAGDLFVGQLEPVELRLLVPDGVDLVEVAPPSLSGEGFTVSPLANARPRESRAEIDGVPMTVLRWSAAVSAVKPGPQTLEARIDGVVVAHAPARSRSARPSLFGDDFFRGSLLERVFGGLRQQRMHLASQPLRLDVQALPEAGRPADFDGAVGEFIFSAQTSSSRATAGDPLTLEARVEGRGNFDRVHVAGLEVAPGFKTYAPAARFEGVDPMGVRGRKLFEQTIIPEQAGSETLPPLRFSYFDPGKQSYVTLTSAVPPLAVASAEQGGSLAAGLLPLRKDLGRLRHNAAPVFLRASWLGALALPLLTLSGVALAAWRRRRRLDPVRARTLAIERTLEQSLRNMEAACEKADALAFHAAVRRALQARLGLRLGANPDALTAADVGGLCADDPRLAASVRRLLEEADAFAYAGCTAGVAALRASRGVVLETLEQLEVHA